MGEFAVSIQAAGTTKNALIIAHKYARSKQKHDVK